jgi:GntR family transcriptional repressor for pyruvate dehydrogenase complex
VNARDRDVRREPSPAERRESPPFEAVEQLRAFQQVIVQIEQAIMDGHLQPGDRLPPERELAEIFRVSRPSVREALRVLEMFGGLVASRGTGANAGSIVAADAQTGLVSALRLHSALGGISTRDLVDVRQILEAHAAERAAIDRHPDGLRRLGDLVAEMKSTEASREEFHRLDSDFHLELSRISGNALLPVLMGALRETMSRERLRAFAGLRDWPRERARLVAEHDEIVERIDAGDTAGAAEAVRNHIERFYRMAVDERRGPSSEDGSSSASNGHDR